MNDGPIMLLAYLDPGTGSMILQIVAAAFLSVGVFFRHAVWGNVARAFRTLSRPFSRRDAN